MKEKEYEKVEHKGNNVLRLKRHTKHKNMFMFYFKKEKKLYRKLYTSPNNTEGQMIERAIGELETFYNRAGRAKVDENITIDAYWIAFRDGKEWGDNHKRTMTGFYDNHIKKYIGNKAVINVKKGDIDRVMTKAKGTSKRLQKGLLEVMEPLFKRAVRDGLLDATPIDDEHQVRREFAKEKKLVFDAEGKFVAVYKAIHTTFANDLKLRTAFLFGFSGRRLMEVLTLKWDDISIKSKVYVIRAENSKVGIDMQFSLGDELAKNLSQMLYDKDSEWIFSSNRDPALHLSKLSMHYDKIREASGVKDFTFHWMRNLYVSAMAARGVDTTDLSAQLGHQDTGTLKKYLSLQREASGKRTEATMLEMLR